MQTFNVQRAGDADKDALTPDNVEAYPITAFQKNGAFLPLVYSTNY